MGKATIEQDEAEAIARFKADNIESDKAKVTALFNSVKAIEIPTFLSDDGIQLGSDITEALAIVKKMIINTANQLVR